MREVFSSSIIYSIEYTVDITNANRVNSQIEDTTYSKHWQ